jgi:hypothetical protein
MSSPVKDHPTVSHVHHQRHILAPTLALAVTSGRRYLFERIAYCAWLARNCMMFLLLRSWFRPCRARAVLLVAPVQHFEGLCASATEVQMSTAWQCWVHGVA